MSSNESDRTHTFESIAAGVSVNHYRILERIGAGGMGEVFLALDTKLNRRVALKFLPTAYCSDPDARARFIREAQAVATLNHPNIVTVYEVGEFLSRPYFAMERVEGQNLHHFALGDSASIDLVLDLAVQMAEGLHEAHLAGIIHRDVKASNVLVDKSGRVKILDFGLAQVRGTSKLTRTGSTLGTVAYMSPEQVQGKAIDQRSDLFSLGTVLYELISGRTPFKRDTDAATMHAIVSEIPEPLARFKSGVPVDLDRLVSKLLQKEVAHRYQTASDLLADLKRLKQDISGGISTPPRASRKIIAVLPFENSGTPEQAYFVDGISDEIVSRLGQLGDLRVIAHSSSLQYKNTTKRIKEIGQELGASYLLQGSIRWDTSSTPHRFRISTKLVQVADETYTWTASYDRVLDQVFAVQSEIAEKVAEALGVALLGGPKKSLHPSGMTTNLEAYDLYLQANECYPHSIAPEDIRKAIDLYGQAIELDPEFAAAHVRYGRSQVARYFFFERNESLLFKAREAIDRGLALAPDLVDGQVALGYYYYQGKRDYERALSHFRVALKAQPNNSSALSSLGFISRRRGEWKESIAAIDRVLLVDPRSPALHANQAISYGLCGHYEKALTLINRAILLQPDWADHYNTKTHIVLHGTGDIAKGIEVFLDAAKVVSIAQCVRDLPTLEVFSAYCGGAEQALKRLEVVDGRTVDFLLFKGYLNWRLDRPEAAEGYFDGVCVTLTRVAEQNPNDGYALSRLGLAWAFRNDKTNALAWAERSCELTSVELDALVGADYMMYLSIVCVLTGEHEKAIDHLERLRTIPSSSVSGMLRTMPLLDPLRSNPRFTALVEQPDFFLPLS